MEHHPDLHGQPVEELEPALAGFAVVDVEPKGSLGRSWVRARRTPS
jgi:hypothetical protein